MFVENGCLGENVILLALVAYARWSDVRDGLCLYARKCCVALVRSRVHCRSLGCCGKRLSGRHTSTQQHKRCTVASSQVTSCTSRPATGCMSCQDSNRSIQGGLPPLLVTVASKWRIGALRPGLRTRLTCKCITWHVYVYWQCYYARCGGGDVH